MGEANVISGADNIGNGRTNHSLYQDNIFTIGKSYIVTFDAKQTVGSGYFQVGQGTAASSSILLTNSFVTYTWEFTAIANTYADSLVFGGRTQSDEFVITNISVKEVGQDWILGSGWSIGDGVALNSGGANFSDLTQLNTNITIGKNYKITYTVSDYVSGSFKFIMNSNTTAGLERNADGTYTDYLTSAAPAYSFRTQGSGFTGSITNISVKEITDDTDLPRINYEGFSYQDVLGSEEVVNGTFDTDSDWNYTTSWEISNGKANFTNIASKGFYQPKVLDANKTYRVSFDYSGTGQVGFLGTAGGSNTLKGFANYTEGNNIIYITPTTTTSAFNIWGNWTGAFSIDNVSVKEYLGQSVVPDSGCGSWLLEPQSTNLETKSNDFSNWGSNVNINTTDNYIVSPDGTQNATRLQWTGGGYMYNTPQGVVSTLFTISCYAKRNDSGTQSVGFFVNGSGVVDSAWSLTSDWVRFTYTYTSTNTSLIGIAGNSGADISVFGFQIEQQSYATSYIPTNGAASTRLQDIANNSGNSTLINSTEGVLYAEIAALANDGTSRRITLSNGTASKIVMISFNNTDNEYRAYVLNGGIVFNYIGAFTSLDFNKIALKFKDNDFALYVNGSKVASDLSGASPIGLNRLDFDGVNGALPFYGKTKAVAVYKEALTDAQLQSLTTI